MSISLRILQQPMADDLPQIHQLLGRDYEKKVFNSIGQEVLRTIVAQCTYAFYSDDLSTMQSIGDTEPKT